MKKLFITLAIALLLALLITGCATLPIKPNLPAGHYISVDKNAPPIQIYANGVLAETITPDGINDIVNQPMQNVPEGKFQATVKVYQNSNWIVVQDNSPAFETSYLSVDANGNAIWTYDVGN